MAQVVQLKTTATAMTYNFDLMKTTLSERSGKKRRERNVGEEALGKKRRDTDIAGRNVGVSTKVERNVGQIKKTSELQQVSQQDVLFVFLALVFKKRLRDLQEGSNVAIAIRSQGSRKIAVRFSTSTTSPTVDGAIQVVHAAFEASERRNRDACLGTRRREVLPQLAVAMKRADFDLHPVAQFGKVLVVGLMQGMSFRNAETEVVEVKGSLRDTGRHRHVPNLRQPFGVRREDFAQVILHWAVDGL